MAAIVLLSASGKRFDQAMARRFAGLSRLILICGRYEGVDERVAEHLADDDVGIREDTERLRAPLQGVLKGFKERAPRPLCIMR